MIAAEVERQQAEARTYAKEMGWNVAGRVAAQNVSPYRCATSWRELGKLTPRIASGRGQTEARPAVIAKLLQFRRPRCGCSVTVRPDASARPVDGGAGLWAAG